MPCYVDGSFHVSIVVSVADILLEEAFTHCCFQVIRKQKQQKIEQPVILICI